MSRETTLKARQGGNLRRRFRRKVNGEYIPFTGVVVRAQIREKTGGRLILDLADYFTVNTDDPTALDLFVPDSVTATFTTDGVWDLFFDGDYITGGPFDLTRSVSMP